MPLSFGRRVAVLLVPWVFIALFAAAYLRIFWPWLTSGAPLQMCVGAFVSLAFLSFSLAAVSFSRDVVTGRYRPTP